MNKLYIQSAKQISIQQPLSEEWMISPVIHNGGMTHAIEANYRDYLSPLEARRMAPIMKRALATAAEAVKQSSIEQIDAIITGTSFGNIECTDKFLNAMIDNGEHLLQPTHFMQSTHNTVGAMLGIQMKCHGYNSTYSHGAFSFELALQDAWTQVQLGRINNVLVGGYDDMLETHYELLRKTEYVGVDGMCVSGDVSVSMCLNTEVGANSLCEIAGVAVCHQFSIEEIRRQLQFLLNAAGLTVDDVSAVFTGVNGNEANDCHYSVITEVLFKHTALVGYKEVFGENYTSPALGIYAAAHCLNRGTIPAFMLYKNGGKAGNQPKSILLFNQQKGKDFSLVLLRKI